MRVRPFPYLYAVTGSTIPLGFPSHPTADRREGVTQLSDGSMHDAQVTTLIAQQCRVVIVLPSQRLLTLTCGDT